MDERMRDAAFAADIAEPWDMAVAGYYGGPDAYNVWSHGDWKRFPNNRKLPIWVAGLDGTGEGHEAVDAKAADGRGSVSTRCANRFDSRPADDQAGRNDRRPEHAEIPAPRPEAGRTRLERERAMEQHQHALEQR